MARLEGRDEERKDGKNDKGVGENSNTPKRELRKREKEREEREEEIESKMHNINNNRHT